MPGGHREEGESPDEAAERELVEETEAIRYTIQSICSIIVFKRKSRFDIEGQVQICHTHPRENRTGW